MLKITNKSQNKFKLIFQIIRIFFKIISNLEFLFSIPSTMNKN